MLASTDLPKFVTDQGYEAVAAAYERRQLIYPLFCDVRSPNELQDAPYGGRNVDAIMDATPKRREEHESSQSSNAQEGYVRQVATPELSRMLRIPQAMLDSSNAQERIGSLVTRWSTQFANQMDLEVETFVAGMLQKGTLTAGSLDYFDQSYVTNTDSNAGFIYDGLPWFDTAHVNKRGANTYSNHTASLGLSAANLETVLTTMIATNAKDENDDEIFIRPDALIVPQALRSTARSTLRSELLPGVSTNDINYVRGELELIVHPFLTDATDAWWVMERNKGLVVYVDDMPTFAEPWYEAATKTWNFEASYRRGAVVTDWRHHYCANKAAS